MFFCASFATYERDSTVDGHNIGWSKTSSEAARNLPMIDDL